MFCEDFLTSMVSHIIHHKTYLNNFKNYELLRDEANALNTILKFSLINSDQL